MKLSELINIIDKRITFTVLQKHTTTTLYKSDKTTYDEKKSSKEAWEKAENKNVAQISLDGDELEIYIETC